MNERKADFRFCPGCGKELPGGAAFCPSCGRSLAERQTPWRPLKAPMIIAGSQGLPSWTVPAIATIVFVAVVGGSLLLSRSNAPAASPSNGGVTSSTGPPSSPGGPVTSSSPTSEASQTASEPIRYHITIDGQTVLLPIDVSFNPRSMPPGDIGDIVERFQREGALVIEDIATPSSSGETLRQPELALESGDFVLEIQRPTAGTIQLVTNFGMWPHTANGPRGEAEFPTHVFELERDVDGHDLAYYVNPNALGPAYLLESVDNVFVSHTSSTRALRVIRVGSIKVRFVDGGDSITGEIDLVGRTSTIGIVLPTPDELSYYRYQATFRGTAQR